MTLQRLDSIISFEHSKQKTSKKPSFSKWLTKMVSFKNCNLSFDQIQRVTFQNTMLQKVSKCEVKAWPCWKLIILLSLQFYVKSNFGEFKRPKNVIFDNFRYSELWIMVNFVLESCSNLLKSKFTTSFLDPLNSPKVDFT